MRIPILLTVGVAAIACARPEEHRAAPDTARDTSATTARTQGPVSVETRSREVLEALKARDGARLAALVHPAKGLRFSLYGHVFTDRDVVIPRDSVARLFGDSTPRLWGEQDGSGDPIRLSFPDFYRRFVYGVDFAAAPQQRIDSTPIRPGNSIFNLRAAYPNARWVERHFPGFDPKYEGMDWRSLWLVFEPVGADWKLVGLVDGRWTI